jgi:uncharacterized iron-regulated protein
MHVARGRLRIILSFALSLLCTVAARADTARGQQAVVERPALVGEIWDVAAQRFVTKEAFYARLQRTDFVLLGEIHNNPRHHRLQKRVIERLVAQGRRPAIVFEMFERDAQPLIERVRKQYPDDARLLARETKMAERGWPARLYRPLIDTVLAHNLPLIGADLSEPTVNEIVMGGMGALSVDRRAMLGLDAPLSEPYLGKMRADIVAAHCGHAPSQIVGGMVDAQRARDASLAHGLIEHGNKDGALLIAGNGHVRGDFAAPMYLRRRVPDKGIVTVALTEISGKRRPASYIPSTPSARRVYDYLWFTRSHDVGNPCERLEKITRGPESSASTMMLKKAR